MNKRNFLKSVMGLFAAPVAAPILTETAAASTGVVGTGALTAALGIATEAKAAAIMPGLIGVTANMVTFSAGGMALLFERVDKVIDQLSDKDWASWNAIPSISERLTEEVKEDVQRWKQAYESGAALPSFSKFVDYPPYMKAIRNAQWAIRHPHDLRHHINCFLTRPPIDGVQKTEKYIPRFARINERRCSREKEYRTARFLLGLLYANSIEYRRKQIKKWWNTIADPVTFRNIITDYVNASADRTYISYKKTGDFSEVSPDYPELLEHFNLTRLFHADGTGRKGLFVLGSWVNFFKNPGWHIEIALSKNFKANSSKYNKARKDTGGFRFDSLYHMGIMKAAQPERVITDFIDVLASGINASFRTTTGEITDHRENKEQTNQWVEPKPKKGRNTDVH